jgi:hypothetical protein
MYKPNVARSKSQKPRPTTGRPTRTQTGTMQRPKYTRTNGRNSSKQPSQIITNKALDKTAPGRAI